MSDSPRIKPRVSPRVMVFIDGQNLFKGLQKRFRARVHPALLAKELTGADRELVGTFYYSGIHDADVDQRMYNLVRRRHDLIHRTGVTVTERTLRYHWEWRVDRGDVPPPWHDDAPPKTKATVTKHRASREKGIDVALALDAVSSILTDACEIAIIVSRDRDLMEIADEVKQRCEGRPVGVEVAYVSEHRGDEQPLTGYDAFWEIDEKMVEAARDHFDYGQKLKRNEVDDFLNDNGFAG